MANEPESFIYAKVQKYSKKWGGEAGGFIFDASSFAPRFMSELDQAGVNASANILRGQNPLQLTAAPLAAAIRAAHAVHAPNARPLPDDVRAGLSVFFRPETLQRAKYAVGTIQITLPNLLGQGNRLMGDGFAVVVDDIIVFNQRAPGFDEPNAMHWWAHEVTHVAQYRDFGIERFAWEYLRDMGRNIEGEADQQGAAVVWLRNQGVQSFASEALHNQALQMNAAAFYNGPIVQTYIPPEYFAVRCYFPYDPYPVAYFLTSRGRIIAVNNLTNEIMHIGWASPAIVPQGGWTYRTNFISYSVLPDGRIFTLPNQFGQVMQVGFTQLLANGQ